MRTVLYDAQTTADQVIAEMSNNSSDYLVWLKNGKRLREELVECDVENDLLFMPKKNGTYLITGGSRGVGLLVAEALAEWEPTIRLLLLSRTMPNKKQWKNAETQAQERLNRLAEKVEVIPFALSVADPSTLQDALKDEPIIDGIFHCAGIAGGGFLINRTWEDFLHVFAPKTRGTVNLFSLAKEKKTKDMVLFSSYSSVLPVPGQADYIGANAFLDAFALKNAEEEINIHVLNWSGFRETGMAKDNDVDMVHSPVEFMDNQQAMTYLRQALAHHETRLLLGRLNYNEIAQKPELLKENFVLSSQIQRRIEQEVSVPADLPVREVFDIHVTGKNTPLSSVEKNLAQVWAKVLGLREVGYEDKFLEIGGDSLSATYLQKEVDKTYPGKMDITDVFVYSSIRLMAEHIQEQIPKEREESAPAESEHRIRAGDKKKMSTMELLERLAAGELNIREAEEQI